MRGMVVCLLMLLATAARADGVTLAADARTALRLTLYQGGVAWVQDTRRAVLPAGTSRITFEGVSPRLVPASVLLRATDGVRIAGITYALERLSADTLLRRSVGRAVEVVRTHPTTGVDEREPADVLAVEDGLVLRYRDRIETGVPGRLVFGEIPDGLAAEPALIATLASVASGAVGFDLAYLSEGLAWSADYAIALDEVARTLDLSARALIVNTAGIGFAEARVALVAGEVRRERDAGVPAPAPMAMARMAEARDAAPAREELADLHLYALSEPLDVADRQTRQVSLLGRAEVPFERTYVSVHQVVARTGERDEPQPEHPEVRYTFRNAGPEKAGPEKTAPENTAPEKTITEPAAAGPLPAGIARLYVRDQGGVLRPIGEDRIPPTAAGAAVRLSPAQASDITIVRRQTAFQEIGSRETGVIEAAWQIDVSNAKREAVVVRLVSVMPGSWSVLAETMPHERETAHRVAWPLAVPADGTARLEYRVRLQR